MRYEAYAHQNFSARGIADVVVTRTDDAGWLQAGVFLIDFWCLGVKDAFFTEMPAHEWPAQMERVIPADDRQALHPACARKLVEGAVAYAQSLGIEPHRDFKKARHAFGSVSARDCPETFTYGKDGKPCFVAGPNDDDARIDRVMRALTARLGETGFSYILPVEPPPDDTDLREDLRELFLDRPPDAPSFESLSGFLTALLVSPEEISATVALDAFWSNQQSRFFRARELLQLNQTLAAYRDQLRGSFEQARESGELSLAVSFADFSYADPEADPAEFRTDAAEWCAGFLQALDLWPTAWQPALERTDLRSRLDTIRLGTGLKPADTATVTQRDDFSDRVAGAVLSLDDFRRSRGPENPTVP